MSGASQKYFTHEIIKNNSKDIRYVLFKNILTIRIY